MPFVDPGPDPNYPDRPDHPHFRLLSELTQGLDKRAEAEDFGLEEFYAEEKIDAGSVDYLALNKARSLAAMVKLPSLTPDQHTELVAALAAAAADGFTIGYLFALNRPDLP